MSVSLLFYTTILTTGSYSFGWKKLFKWLFRIILNPYPHVKRFVDVHLLYHFLWFGKSCSFKILPTLLCTSIIYYHLSTILTKFYFKCKIDIYLDPIYLKIQWIENKNTVPFCDQLKLKLEKLDILIFLKIRVKGDINTCKYKHSNRFGGQLPVLKRLKAIVLLMYNRWFLSLYRMMKR